MDELQLPAVFRLQKRFKKLHRICKTRHQSQRVEGNARIGRLLADDRQKILSATNGRCHIGGGAIDGRWQADHVLAHAGGGRHALDNYLPAHQLCNNYRWDYDAEEFQWILKIGVWAKSQMEHASKDSLGRKMLETFFAYDQKRKRGRKILRDPVA